MTKRDKLSVVIPVFNEEKNIPILYKQLLENLKKISTNYEIIFINDGSHDNSLAEIKKLRNKNKKVKYLSFSRNFGHMPALEAGLGAASGQRIVLMDADLQDPPKIIPKLYNKMNEGYKVVYAIKVSRKESELKVFMFNSFYRLLNLISNYEMPLDAGTFSIIDREVADILLQLPERNKYFSGLRAWAGFAQTGIVYKRGRRIHGKANSFSRLFKLAINGLLSFSYVPLRLASLFGFGCAILSMVSIIFVIFLRIFLGFGISGWPSTISLILLVSGIQLITLGIIGEYLARIYDEVKKRPEYIIEESQGI